ncbi:winged helix-turn-helix transcriptional regulator [Actinoplanes oblitus]|uniref:Winged helix-turn-helix transcriptional regulator n=1 Tax=Actinoplanes oblitus TaxID=3040509 RepID=A0ABY8W5Y7_9ACTN|nr:winged helix-turn-helix transcriptional regulator [Actinoplanes oblitus]WIM93113.1 winged helix-turn-helix transcriptional regulator [Actinoplanes oblitus]
MREIHALLGEILKPRWAGPVLVDLAVRGPGRYTDLQDRLASSSGRHVHNQSLSGALRRLQRHALITQDPAIQGGEYILTQLGAELADHLALLDRWGRRYRDRLRLNSHR